MGLVPINDMQIPLQPPPPLKSGQIGFLVQKDAQCSEIYEKTVFRYSNSYTQIPILKQYSGFANLI